MKLTIACAVLLASLTAPCVADEHPSAAAATTIAVPTAQPQALAANVPEPRPAVAAAIPESALPAAPSAVIIIKKSQREAHKFLDTTNTLALGAAAAGLTADALSTQKGLGLPGFHEVNPIARPFVQTRGGAAVYSVGSFSLLTGAMYVAHKTGHHKLERILPFATAGWEGLLSVRNYHVIAQHTK